MVNPAGLLPATMRGKATNYYWYGQTATVPAGGVVVSSVTIDNVANLIIVRAAAQVVDDVVGTSIVDPLIDVLPNDSSSGENFGNFAMPLGMIFSMTGLAAGGAAGDSGDLGVARIVLAGGTIATTFSSRETNPVTIRYAYIGARVYHVSETVKFG